MNKMGYLNQIYKVDQYFDPNTGESRLVAHELLGSKTIIDYVNNCHIDQIELYLVDKLGRIRHLKPRDNNGRMAIRKGDSIISINELIYQYHNISNGKKVEHGEFNHHLPVCWSDCVGGERFSPSAGDICSPQQNKAHWECLARIYRETGYKCSMSTYSPGYSILSYPTITKSLVQQYDKLGWLTIVG